MINHWVRDQEQFETGALYLKEIQELEKQEHSMFWDTVFIKGINISKAQFSFSKDVDAFVETLKSYSNHTLFLIENLRNFTRETLPHYAIIIHGIKGASYGISAEQVGKQAEALEAAAKTGNLEFLLNYNAAFISLIETLVWDIRSFLAEWQGEDQRPKKNAPDPELLAVLSEACQKYDVVGIEKVMGKLEQFQYETQAELITWLSEEITISDFDTIAERLSVDHIQ